MLLDVTGVEDGISPAEVVAEPVGCGPVVVACVDWGHGLESLVTVASRGPVMLRLTENNAGAE